VIGSGRIGISRRHRGVSLRLGVIEGITRRLLFGTLCPGRQDPTAGIVIIVVWLRILSRPGRIVSGRDDSSVIGCLRVGRIDVLHSRLLGLRYPWRSPIIILIRVLVEILARNIVLARIDRVRRPVVSIPMNDRLEFLLPGFRCWRSPWMHS